MKHRHNGKEISDPVGQPGSLDTRSAAITKQELLESVEELTAAEAAVLAQPWDYDRDHVAEVEEKQNRRIEQMSKLKRQIQIGRAGCQYTRG